MAVPKFKVSKSKQRKRRTHDRHKLSAPHLVPCEACGAKNPPHTICSVCGAYAAHGKKGARSRLIQVHKNDD